VYVHNRSVTIATDVGVGGKEPSATGSEAMIITYMYIK